ncbi:MAG TPA: T9SS type A sorting domain-containing protein [Flavipsychrobacter sp.]|nr:T9SS type A sorting domain-containing protein [Flavipsychrobacter sp.]
MLRISLVIMLAGMCVMAHAQQVISPTNFLKGNSTPLRHERHINAVELPNGEGYLFTMTTDTAYNLSIQGEYLTSAKIIKTDVNGNVLASYIVNKKASSKIVYSAISVTLDSASIHFFVSCDSAVLNSNPYNKGMIVVHLDRNSLSYKSSDTFPHLLPANMMITNWLSVSKYHAATNYIAFVYEIPLAFKYYNKIFKFTTRLGVTRMDTSLSIESAHPILDTNFLIFINNVCFNAAGDSLNMFLTCKEKGFFQSKFCFITFDTSLTGQSQYKSFDCHFEYYTSGKFYATPIFTEGKILQHQAILGPRVETESDDRVGFMKFRVKDTITYVKTLLLPDTFFSISKKYSSFMNNDPGDGNLYCLAYDYRLPSRLYFDTVENHIYIGKTDTSLNSWHWYKYIGNPHCYHVPYKLLATSDGGCMITAGIYDYVNSPNLQHDVYIIKLDANGGITHVSNITGNTGRQVSVYPVPAQQQVFFSYSGSGKFDCFIYDLSGRVVLSQKSLSSGSTSISIAHFPAGQYVYKIQFADGRQETGKLLKQ